VIKSRDLNLAKRVLWRYRYHTVREHIPILHGGNYTEDGSKKSSRIRYILIMWTKTTRVLLLLPLRLRPLFFHTDTCFSFSVGLAVEVSIRNCTLEHYQIACQQLPWRWKQKTIFESRSFLIMWTNSPEYYFFFHDFGGLCRFLDYQTAWRQPPWWWHHFFQTKPILFDNVSMHLLHSWTHCDLDHSCSILHK